MPIYEYHCQACGKRFEKLVRLTTKTEEVECPKCGARRAEKAVSRLGAIGAPRSGGASGPKSCGPIG